MSTSQGWWNSATALRLEKLWKEGHNYDALATMLGAPNRMAVYGRAKKLGLLERFPRTAKRKKTPKVPVITASGWPKAKTCLKCRDKFQSEGLHNHVCPACTRHNSRELDTHTAW